MSSSEPRDARVPCAEPASADHDGAGSQSAGLDAGPDAGPSPPPAGRRRGRDGGFVTAETAVVLPALVLFAMGLVWALLAAAAQIQCVDAARAGARAVARQDPYAAAVEAAERAAPKGARVTVRREGDLVRVRVEADTPGPAALALHLRQEAVALSEDSVGRSGAGSGPSTPADEAAPGNGAVPPANDPVPGNDPAGVGEP